MEVGGSGVDEETEAVRRSNREFDKIRRSWCRVDMDDGTHG